MPSAGRLDITKTQTVTTLSSGTLGTSVRSGATAVTTRVEFSNADVTAVLDAEEKQAAGAGTAFAHPAATATSVVRRGDGASSSDTTTRYTRASSGDVHGRITTVARKLGAAWITTTTAFDATYPIEVASVTEDDGGSLERTTTHQYVAASMGLLLVTKEPLTTTPSVTRRWTQYTYNANNDVTQKTVSLDGSATVRTVTRYCYAASGCATSGTTATMRAVIENYVDGTKGGAQGHEEDITTEYLYDAYGQRTRETRYNYAAGALADDRATGFVYDTFGNLTKEIDNYVDGVVSPNSLDTTPAAGSSVRTDLTTTYAYDTAGNRVATTDPRRAIAASSTTYARDAFERTVADGWGTADTGGAWSGTTADHDVTGSVGAVILGSNTNRNAYLTSVSAQDAEILFKVNVDQLAVGSDHLVWAYLRRQDSSNYYQVRITLNTSGSITATFNRTAAGSSTVIDAATTTVPHAVSDWYWVRARISGTTAVEGRIRLWKDGTTEPVEWAAEGTDASPPAALQGTGHVGLRFQLGGSYSGTYPVTASFDEFTVTTIGGGGQALGGDDYVSRSTFDALDQAVTQLTPTTPGVTIAQKTASSVYDEFGAVRRATDYGGVVTATASDRAGRPTETFEDTPTAAAASTSQTVYDPSGRTISEKDRRQVAGSLGVTLYAYDELGRQIAVSVGDGTSHESEDDSTYDALDRLIALEVGVDGPGNPSPSSQLTTYVYDPGDRIVETDDQSSCGTSTYDYRDLPQTTTDGLVGGSCGSGTDTRTTTKTYDGRGRLLVAEVTAGPGTGDRTTIDAFDSVGNKLSTAVRKSGVTTTTTFGIDRLDQTTSEVRPDGSTAKTTYDAVGNALDRCFWKPAISVGDCLPVASSGWTNPPTQSTSTSYDARNERIGLVDGSSNQTTVYDSDHNYQTKALYTPTKADLTVELQTLTSYDDRHRVSEVKHQLCTISAGHACSSTTLVGESDYLYDDNDNRTKVLENNGAATTDLRYCYDALDRLQYRNTAAACGSAAKDETYVFDDAGNRTQTVVGGVTTNFAYDAEGRLCKTAATSCTSPNVTYDTAGRTKTWNGWTFGYDPDGRLLTACKSATCANTADKVEFTYDGEGHRTRILTDPAGTGAGQGPVTRTFRYQADAIVEETLTDATHTDAVVRSYVVDDTGSVVRMTIPAGEPGAGTYLPVYNGHGDTVNLSKLDPVTGSLTLANSFGYSTWGRPTTTTHNAIPDLGFRFAYVGEFDVQWDDAFGLDLLYMQARHYSPALGRFLQPDPDRSESNLYAYAANNPVTEIDPDGTCFIVCQLVVGAVIDSIVYLATTENASLDGLAGAVVSGAVESAVNPLAKISKVTKLVTAASKILIKVPKAVRKVQRAVNKSRGRSVASCTRHSFDAETLVTLADGSRVEIASLSVGDEVLAWDEASGKTGAYPITAVWAHDDAVTGIVVIDGEAIATTPGHPFYTVERGWVQAADLRTGDHVSSLAGAVGSVSSVTWLRGPDRMFDVTVANAHTFSVGTGAWLVHNANCRLSDVTVKSERAARRQAFRDHKIPTSIGGRPFERIKRYGTNPNLRGRRGEPSEEIRVRGRAPIEHHSNGHRFPDRVTGPHYHGAGRHIYYPSRK